MAEPQPLEAFSSAWVGPRRPKMLIIGEAFGEHELAHKQPFVGTSGKELWRMLAEAIPEQLELRSEADRTLDYGAAWIRHRSSWLEALGISFTNVLNLRPPGNDLAGLCTGKLEAQGRSLQWPALVKGKYLAERYFPEVDRLFEEIRLASPNVVVAAGNTACWALLRATNIGSIRGTTALFQASGPGDLERAEETSLTARLQQRKVLPTYHPAGVLRQWAWRPVVVADLMKAWREAASPQLVRPQRFVLVNPTIEECEAWTEQTIGSKTWDSLSCDIETGAGQIKCVGFARSRSEALVIPFVDTGRPGWSYWATEIEELRAWECVSRLLGSGIPKVFQNGMYDLQYLTRLGLRPANCQDDTMLLHHSLHPELQKGLGFLGSIYTNEASWKLMRRERPDSEKRDE